MSYERSFEGMHEGASERSATSGASPMDNATVESLADGQRRGEQVSGAHAAIPEGLLIDGRYRVMRLLAEGGMGRVMVARHEVTGATVALKVLRADVADETSDERFTREIRVATRVAHPHVIRILDGGRMPDGAPYYVMELLDGIDLSELLTRECRLPPARALRVLGQLAETLDYAHARGVVHRDLKPENVMIDERRDDYVTVLDFGIARQMGSAAAGLTQRGIVLGTPAYMSPEHALGISTGPSSDHYALAAIALEMLTGSLPHEQHATPLLTIDGLLRCRARAPSELGLDVPGLDAVFARALAHEPEQRFASAIAFVQALAKVLGTESGRVALPNVAATSLLPPPSGPSASEPRLPTDARHAPPAPVVPTSAESTGGSSVVLAGPAPRGMWRGATLAIVAATGVALSTIAWIVWHRAAVIAEEAVLFPTAAMAAPPEHTSAASEVLPPVPDVVDEPPMEPVAAPPMIDMPRETSGAQEAGAVDESPARAAVAAPRRVMGRRRITDRRADAVDAAGSGIQPALPRAPVASEEPPQPEAPPPHRAPPHAPEFIEDPGF